MGVSAASELGNVIGLIEVEYAAAAVTG